LAERRSPKPKVGGSMPSWPAKIENVNESLVIIQRKLGFIKLTTNTLR
jgi:hypothetical protein